MPTHKFFLEDRSPFDQVAGMDVGATLPTIDVQLFDGKDPVDLTGATSVLFSMFDQDGVPKVSGATAALLDAANGKVRYVWVGADVDTSGIFLGQFEVTMPAGGIFKIPNNNSQRLLVNVGNVQLAGLSLGANLVALHAPAHLLGGADALDADQVGIDVAFANITPDTSPPEVSSVKHLGAILKGIDNDIGGSGGGGGDATASPGIDTIQAAHDGLPANGGKIVLSAGVYDMATLVTITKPNVKIVGSGPATILDVTNATGGFSVSATGFRIKQVLQKLNNAGGSLVGIDVVAGGTQAKAVDVDFENTLGANTAFIQSAAAETKPFNCRTSIAAGSVAHAFSMLAGGTDSSFLYIDVNDSEGFLILGTRGRLEHCRVYGFVGRGIDIDAPECAVINYFSETGSRGIRIGPLGDRSTVSVAHIVCPQDATSVEGVRIESGGDDCNVENCWVDGSGNTGTSSNGFKVNAHRSSFSNCRAENMGDIGFDFNQGDQHVVTTCRAFSCNRGFLITSSQLSQFSNCRGESNTLDGILLRTASNRSTLTGCFCNSNTRHGISVEATTFSNITGCHAHLNGADGIQEASSANDNNFTGNHAVGNTSANYTFVGSRTVATANF